MATCREQLSPRFGWQHRFWNLSAVEALLAQHRPEFLPMFQGFPKLVQRIDMAKYLVLEVFGGEPWQPSYWVLGLYARRQPRQGTCEVTRLACTFCTARGRLQRAVGVQCVCTLLHATGKSRPLLPGASNPTWPKAS